MYLVIYNALKYVKREIIVCVYTSICSGRDNVINLNQYCQTLLMWTLKRPQNEIQEVPVLMLWFNFIFGSIFIFLCFCVW